MRCVLVTKNIVYDIIVHFTPVTMSTPAHVSTVCLSHLGHFKYVYPQNITLHLVLPTVLTVGGFNETLCLMELQTPAFISLAFTTMMKCPLMDRKLLHRPFFPLTNHACILGRLSGYK